MDIWEEMYLKAKEEYHPEDISPFLTAHHVVAALQSAKTGKIYTGFCMVECLVELVENFLCRQHMKIEIWKY